MCCGTFCAISLQNRPKLFYPNQLLWNSWIQLSRYEMNPLNESFSMNVFRMRGMALYTWQTEVHVLRESDA
jgi:hypothetical protein